MRELRLVLLGLAAVIALLLGANFLLRAFRVPGVPPLAQTTVPEPSQVADVPSTVPTATAVPPSVPSAPPAARAIVDRAITDAPDYTRFFDRLRLAFPSDNEAILNTLANGVANGGEANVDLMTADAVAALRRSHGALAAQASDATLAQVFVLQLQEMQALARRDAHLCVAFLYGANGAGFQGFAADHRPLVADAAIAGLDAINSGSMEHVRRPAPSDSDFQALDRALVTKGLSRPEIEALLDGKSAIPPIPDDAMCRAGQAYLATLATLPSDVRDRLYALAVDVEGDAGQPQASKASP